jgi:hypothetical protein
MSVSITRFLRYIRDSCEAAEKANISESPMWAKLFTVLSMTRSRADWETFNAVERMPRPGVLSDAEYQIDSGTENILIKHHDTTPINDNAKSCMRAASPKMSLKGSLKAGPGLAKSNNETLPIL